MKITVTAKAGDQTAILDFDNCQYSCMIGRSGIVPAADKIEGDGASPEGTWPLRRVFWRSDRTSRPVTDLEVLELSQDMGWSDDPEDSEAYNSLVTLPYSPSHEKMWREDCLYDLVVELGYNDNPPVPGLGSAIFLHVMHPDRTPTAGCAAIRIDDLHKILRKCEPGATLEFRTA